MPGEAMIVTLSCPALRLAQDGAQHHAGIGAGGVPAEQACTMRIVACRNASRSTPIAAAGTMPKLDSTE